MKTYCLYILDLDGTLFRGDQPLPHAVEVVKELRSRGAMLRFLTNNSGRTRQFYAEKLTRLGFQAEAEEIYSSAIGTARWLREQSIQTVFVVGEQGLVDTLATEGITTVNIGLSDKRAPQAQAVVAGICRDLTYTWIDSAMQQILGGARFIATNPDTTYPMEGGTLVPGAGAIVASIQACSSVQPTVIGKPNPYLIHLILEDAGVSTEDALVVGDRVDTDLEAGRAAGCDTLLVLTGVTEQPVAGYDHAADLRALLTS